MGNSKPTLVIMAAGMGSRFKGLKQMTSVDEYGRSLMDYAIFDALEAGFGDVVFIIRRDFADAFKEQVGSRIEKMAPVTYVYQELTDIPEGSSLPEGRVKPWGTTHAIWSAREVLEGKAFLTINADDYYGKDAFAKAVKFFEENDKDSQFACIGYNVVMTLESQGTVSRGICKVDADDYLIRIDERKKIKLDQNRGYYTLDDGVTFHLIPEDALASMNLWAFNPGFLSDIEKTFPERLANGLVKNPDTFEETLSDAVQNMIERSACTVKILKTNATWFGMTYAEDLQTVKDSLAELVKEGKYPDGEWK